MIFNKNRLLSTCFSQSHPLFLLNNLEFSLDKANSAIIEVKYIFTSFLCLAPYKLGSIVNLDILPGE